MYTSPTTAQASQMADRKLPGHFLEMSWCNKAISSDIDYATRFTTSIAQASKGCQRKHINIYKSLTTAHAPQMGERKLPRHFLEMSRCNKATSSDIVNSARIKISTAQAFQGCEQKHLNMYTSVTTAQAPQTTNRKVPRHFLEMSW